MFLTFGALPDLNPEMNIIMNGGVDARVLMPSGRDDPSRP
jgi:hypothetical protein